MTQMRVTCMFTINVPDNYQLTKPEKKPLRLKMCMLSRQLVCDRSSVPTTRSLQRFALSIWIKALLKPEKKPLRLKMCMLSRQLVCDRSSVPTTRSLQRFALSIWIKALLKF